MMEFTFDGIVRQGFGFYNPNHAAALICAIFPFFWGWKKMTWLGWLASIALTIPLALTYSRTGILVLFFELMLYLIFSKGKNWKWISGMYIGLFFILILWGVFQRFTLDRSIVNRPEIWIAGLKLYAVNPWGVALGNSGLLVSTFMLDNIFCRTLINSHLTLLTEQGIIFAFLWFFSIFYATINIKRHLRIGISFLGLTLSASCSTIFDWSILSDFWEYGQLGLCNFILSWILLLFFAMLGIVLMIGRANWKRILIAAVIAGMIVTVPLLFRTDAPQVRCGCVLRTGNPQVFVMYDNDWTLKTIYPMLKSGYVLPLRPRQIIATPVGSEVWLFGTMVEFSDYFKQQKLVLVNPPDFFLMPPNVVKILVPRFPQRIFDNIQVESY